MRNYSLITVALFAAFATLSGGPALADGEVQLTHAKALSGNITPGDTAGYPITLSQPGTYKLAGNLIVPASKIGIHVTSSLVTIDLNGFTLQGSNVAAHGIWGGFSSVTIKNGTIVAFKYDGIHGAGDFWSIEDMRVVGNGRDGIWVGDNTRAIRNTISKNTRYGVHCNSACHIEGNLVSFSGDIGLYVLTGTVLGNTLIKNVSYGLYIFTARSATTR